MRAGAARVVFCSATCDMGPCSMLRVRAGVEGRDFPSARFSSVVTGLF
jgi:hypothetical protein